MARQRIRAHASRWNTFTLKKKVMMAEFQSETERHCEAKKKKQPPPHIPSFAAFTENGRGHNAQTCSLGDGPTFAVEKLVTTSVKNLLDYSTYLRFAFGSDQRRNRTVISLHTGAETRRQCFKSQEKPAESFAARKNCAAQLLRKNSIDLWSIPPTSFDAARPNGKTLSRDATESCIRYRRMRKKKTADHEHRKGVTRYQQSEGIKGQRSGDASQRWLEVARKVI